MIATQIIGARRAVAMEEDSWVGFSHGTSTTYEALNVYESTIGVLSGTQAIVVYNTGDTGKARVLENASGTTATAGAAYTFDSSVISSGYSVCGLTSTTAIITYLDLTNGYLGMAVVATINPGTKAITFGTPFQFELTASTPVISMRALRISDTHALIAYRALTPGIASSYGRAVVVDTSSNVGSAVTFDSENLSSVDACMLSESAFVVLYAKAGYPYVMHGALSGTTITFTGDSVALYPDEVLNYANLAIASVSATQIMVCFSTKTATKVIGAAISGTTITKTLPTTIGTTGMGIRIVPISSVQCLCVWKSYSESVYTNTMASIVNYGAVHPIQGHSAQLTEAETQYLDLVKISAEKTILIFRVLVSSPYSGMSKIIYST